MRRALKWTLIVIGLTLAVGIIGVIGAVVGVLRDLSKNGPSPPPRSQLVPVGRAADLGAGWRLRVLRVTANAAREVKAAENANPPPSGSRYFLIKLAVTYTGRGKGDPSTLAGYGLEAKGANGASYDTTHNWCGDYVPKSALGRAGPVFPGQTARGYLCFQIAANDARTLVLYAGNSSEFFRVDGLKRVWFALH